MLFLPLAHVFARVIQVGLGAGAGPARPQCRHVQTWCATSAQFQPTFVLAVPRVFEKVFNTASQNATADGRGRVFERAAEVAIAWSRGLDSGEAGRRRWSGPSTRRSPGWSTDGCGRLSGAGASTPCPAALRSANGSGHFYRGIGLTVLEGYGLTETTAALTVNTPGAVKIGTVGRPLPGTSVRVADDGELLFFGGQVFAGYWPGDGAAEVATAEVLERDGWFHTGDVGEIDDEGFVRITGRKKEILVTAGGKNVAPALLEDRLRAHALVSQCMVVGDGRPFIGALVTLDRTRSPPGPPRTAKTTVVADLVDDPDLRAEIDDGRRGREQGRLEGRVDPQVRPAPGRLDRGGRPAHPEPQAEARRGDARASRRRGRALRDLIAGGA